MRSPSMFLMLVLAGTALSGCATGFEEAYVNSAALVDGPGGDGLSGDEPTGEDNGGDLPPGAGDTSLVSTEDSRVVDGSARTALTLNTDPDIPGNFTTATVVVDPGQPIGFVGEQQLAVFEQRTTEPAAGFVNPAAATWLGNHSVEDSEYSEFRRISPADGIDVELQYWDFTGAAGTDSYVAHFRDANNNQDAWFYGEANDADSRTTADQITTLGGATLNYEGSYVGQAETTGWGEASSYQTLDGSWRVQGHAEVTLDLGSSAMTGTLTPQFWEKTESNGTVVQIDVHRQVADEYLVQSTTPADITDPPIAASGDIASFHNADVQLSGNITDDGGINGTATVTDPGPGGAGWVNGDQALSAATYGANAEQVSGVFSVYAVKPSPIGGDTGINDDRRGTFDLQGGFGAVQGGDPMDPIPTPVPPTP